MTLASRQCTGVGVTSADRRADGRRQTGWLIVVGVLGFAVGMGLLAGFNGLRASTADPRPTAEADAVADSSGAPAAAIATDSWGRGLLLAGPRIDHDAPPVVFAEDGPVVITGTVTNDAVVLARGAEVEQDGSRFTLSFEGEPPESIFAITPAGRSNTEPLDIAIVPSRVTVDEIRALHVSFYGWVDSRLRDPILEMVEEGRINTVQLDLKDESGMIGYDSTLPLAEQAGTNAAIFDLREAVRELHERDVHVIGRIVAFADPAFVRWGWDNDHRDSVVQTPDGQVYTGRYAGFTNPANDTIRQYNIDIAVEAAKAGVDGILWDYIRRPDGSLDNFRFVGLDDSDPTDEIVSFVAEADEALAPYQVEHGVSVYGIAATRPGQIAQDIAGMSEHVDYVAPMLYPSHWGPGEYGVADPNRQPYDIIYRSLAGFIDITEDKRARVVPWLQDFSLGVTYGEAEVRAQLDAARDAGIPEWIMWDAHVRYTRAAYDPVD